MKRCFYTGVIAYCLSFQLQATTPNSICTGVTGPNFTRGDGTPGNPFLICNQAQFAQIGTDATRLSQSYILGADLSFNGMAFPMIGALGNPYRGTFDGNGYTLSSISIDGGFNSYIAIFRYVENATVKNLFIDGVSASNVGQFVGGLAALVKFSTITNIKIKNINLPGPDYSGGLIGEADNSSISNVSTQGTMAQNFGTDAGGGLIGLAFDCQISNSVSHVNLVQASTTAFGVSAVGGLVGFAIRGTATNCYADGNIDYSAVRDKNLFAKQVGGLFGVGDTIVVNNAYYAGKITINPNVTQLGGAAGEFVGAPYSNVFWDTMVSGLSQSPLGVGKSTCLMKQKLFWVTQGFDQTIWTLENGVYPKLAFES